MKGLDLQALLQLIKENESSLDFVKELNKLPETLEKLNKISNTLNINIDDSIEKLVLANKQNELDKYNSIIVDLKKYIEENNTLKSLSMKNTKLYNKIRATGEGIIFFLNKIYGESFNYSDLFSENKIPKEFFNTKRILNSKTNKTKNFLNVNKDNVEEILNKVYVKYGYMPEKKILEEEIPNLSKLVSSYKKMVEQYNYVTYRDLVIRFAYELDIKNEMRCPHCGEPMVVKFTGSSTTDKRIHGYCCRSCSKRFAGVVYAEKHMNEYYLGIKERLNKNINSHIIFCHKDVKLNLNITDNENVIMYEFENAPEKQPRLIWTEAMLVTRLNNIYAKLGYIPVYTTLASKYKLASPIMKFGGYINIMTKYNYITENELKYRKGIVVQRENSIIEQQCG